MARSNRSRGRNGRGRRNVLTVREASYQLPVVEPCNFMEMDFEIQSSTSDSSLSLPTFAQIAARLPAGVGKFRITSLVVDPLTGAIPNGGTAGFSGVANIPYELTMNISSNHYESGDTSKPLRIKLSNAMGSDGQWMRVVSDTVIVAAFLRTVSTDTLGNLNQAGQSIGELSSDAPGITGLDMAIATDLHVRVAFTDLASV